MRSPRKLLTFHIDPGTIASPRVPTLVHAFQGFVDAGGGVRQAAAHIRETCTTELVATFDSDELLDYRARRPRYGQGRPTMEAPRHLLTRGGGARAGCKAVDSDLRLMRPRCDRRRYCHHAAPNLPSSSIAARRRDRTTISVSLRPPTGWRSRGGGGW